MIDPVSTALSGMQNAARTVSSAATRIAAPQTAPDDASMVRDIVDIKTAETAYKANAAVLRTVDAMQDEMMKIIDTTV